MDFLVILLGIFGGVSVGLQTPIVGMMGKRIGANASTFVVHVSGSIITGLALLLSGGEKIREWRTLPWYMLGSGIFGFVLFYTIGKTIPKLGASSAITLIIVGQLIAGMVIDQFGLFEAVQRSIDPTKIIAALMLIGGGYLMLK